MPSECVLILLRHGATDHNLSNPPVLQGQRIDVGLSRNGQRQARAAADLFSTLPVAAVFSSPLLRARETAQIVAAPHRLGVQTIDALSEADVGLWEARSWNEISQNDPVAYQSFLQDPARHGYLGGENLTDVQQRTFPAILRLLADNIGRTIVVVGHNVVNRVLIAHVMNIPLRYARQISQDNCGISILSYADETIKVKTLNTTFHLPDSLGNFPATARESGELMQLRHNDA
jgi:broad specificity phosphatase PhoE